MQLSFILIAAELTCILRGLSEESNIHLMRMQQKAAACVPGGVSTHGGRDFNAGLRALAIYHCVRERKFVGIFSEKKELYVRKRRKSIWGGRFSQSHTGRAHQSMGRRGEKPRWVFILWHRRFATMDKNVKYIHPILCLCAGIECAPSRKSQRTASHCAPLLYSSLFVIVLFFRFLIESNHRASKCILLVLSCGKSLKLFSLLTIENQ